METWSQAKEICLVLLYKSVLVSVVLLSSDKMFIYCRLNAHLNLT